MATDDGDALLRLYRTWPVSTIDGNPSLTTGTLEVYEDASAGGFTLQISQGDENFPDHTMVQFPLSAENVELLRRALSGEVVGEVDERHG